MLHANAQCMQAFPYAVCGSLISMCSVLKAMQTHLNAVAILLYPLATEMSVIFEALFDFFGSIAGGWGMTARCPML